MKIQEERLAKGQSCTFLESVAKAYAARYDEMSDICFLFPNKRAGTFFLKALSESMGERTMLAPEVMGVSEFMTRVSEREVASRSRHGRRLLPEISAKSRNMMSTRLRYSGM